jgi:2-polyprenyl-3-methyl-5-hydroxy-6-metoxy-1,4-benzoquinol methylase
MTELASRHALPRVPVVEREDYILNKCRGKRVLLLGCANWPYTESLYDQQLLLHQRMEKVSSELAGTDISAEGIDFLKGKSMKNLFVSDAFKMEDVIRSLPWTPELIVAGEMIEHLDEPGAVLREYSRVMPAECTLLITVPNALSIKGLLHVMLGHEKVHDGHVAYYSSITMSNLLKRCGLMPVNVLYYRHSSTNAMDFVLNTVLYPLFLLRPHLSPGLIVCCKLAGD